MRKVLKAVSITLLWVAGAGAAVAAPGQGPGWRDGQYTTIRQERIVERQGRYVDRQDGARYREQFNYGQERRRVGPSDFQQYQDHNSYGNRPGEAGPDGQRRSGRLTPEERRALRRQINEAGRDIYIPYPPPPR